MSEIEGREFYSSDDTSMARGKVSEIPIEHEGLKSGDKLPLFSLLASSLLDSDAKPVEPENLQKAMNIIVMYLDPRYVLCL
jgi:hypothetical protein